MNQEQLSDFLYHIPANIIYEFILPDTVVNNQNESFRLMESTDVKYERLECPCCLEEIKDAVFTKCGHKFCVSCIDKFLNTNSCPDCRCNIAKVSVDYEFTTLSFDDFITEYEEFDDQTKLNEYLLEVIDMDALFESNKWVEYI